MMKIKSLILTAMQLVIPAFAFAYNGQDGMWPGMMCWSQSMSWPMMLFMMLFWIAILAGIFTLIRSVFSRGGHDVKLPAESPLDILKKRYASGEISKEELEERKQVIEE